MDRSSCPTTRVHPRVGGGAPRSRRSPRSPRGPSPRGRGSRRYPGAGCLGDGSIPAWAGEPRSTSPAARRCRVHPRVGGGATEVALVSEQHRGPSPRGRGSRAEARSATSTTGSIPAWAGEPSPTPSWGSSCKVHPRVGGGAIYSKSRQPSQYGPSPRGRGSHALVRDVRDATRSIPAWAGEPSKVTPCRPGNRVHPRVGGGASGDILTTLGA